MKLKNIFVALCLLATVAASAQEAEAPASPWKFSGLVGLNASATGLVNWAAGGNNNISGVAFGKLNLDYAKDNLEWNTTLDLEYGLTWVDQKYDKLQKSSDRINFSTKFGYQFANKVFVAASAGFQSQFALGRTYPGDGTDGDIISKFLAPSFTDISVGIDYKPVDFFSLYVSPVAGRITTAYVSDRINNKYAADYPLEVGGLREKLQEANGTYKYVYNEVANDYIKQYRNARAELGMNIKASLNYAYKDLKIISTLGLFTPYAWDKTEMYQWTDGNIYSKDQMSAHGFDIDPEYFIGYKDNNRRFGFFDVDWSVAISYQFLKCLNVTLSTNLKYINGLKIDKVVVDELGVETIESKERVQFQGIIGLGVGYSF